MRRDKNCVFCKIVEGTIPAIKIYEDEEVLAFLDIAPINPGHALVIPKEHFSGCGGMPEALGGRLFHLAARIGTACKRALNADGFNLHLAEGGCAGQEVPHAHIHVIPRAPEDGFHWNWRKVEYADAAARQACAKQIIDKLKTE